MGPARWLQIFLVGFLVGTLVTQYFFVPPQTVIWLSLCSIAISIGLAKYHIAKTGLFLLLIGAAMAILRSTVYNQTLTLRPDILAKFSSFRSYTIEKMTAKMPEPEGHLSASIILGGQGTLPQQLIQPMIRTGTIHMAAVSGANLTIILSLASVILPFLLGRWLGFGFGTTAILLFLTLTGFEPSIIRASILGWFFLLSRASHRLVNPIHTALIVAGIMIATQPKLITNIGFQLSFASYLGLVLFESSIGQYIEKTWFGRWPFFKESLSSTLAAQIFSLPLIIHYFGRLSIVSLPANVVIGYLVTVVMFLGVFGLALTFVPIIGQWLALGLAPFAWAIEKLVVWFNAMPLASVATPSLPSWILILYYGTFAIIILLRSINRLAYD